MSVWLTGNQEPIRVEINPSLLLEDKASVEESILEALKSSYEESTSTMKSKMEKLTGGLNLNLPGISEDS